MKIIGSPVFEEQETLGWVEIIEVDSGVAACCLECIVGRFVFFGWLVAECVRADSSG